MSIKKIDKNELRGYEGKEGLILQGCGGNPQEWVDGINDLFTKEGILLDETKFSDDNCAVFEISWADSVSQERRSLTARLSDRTVTSSTLWGLPQEHCGIMGLQSNQRK